MFKFLQSTNQLRQQAWEKARHPVMLKYLSREFPSPKAPWDEIEIVSLDFETTGLDPKNHQILSYGLVTIRKGSIQLASAKHELVRPESQIPEESAIIHHITDDEASTARSLEQVLPELLHNLGGKVMLVHYQKIEQGFLNAACQKLYGSPFIIPIIDTLVLSQRVLERRNHSLEPNQLRLFNLRDSFKLPVYKAHNAFYDALTTAELFMMLEGEISPNDSTPIKRLLS
jgi:DNA polymerase III subunit epsilon